MSDIKNSQLEVLAQYDVNGINGDVFAKMSLLVEECLHKTFGSKLVNSNDEVGYKAAMSYIWNCVLHAHNLDKYDTSLQGYDLAQFKLDPVFKFLVIPRFIGLNGDSYDVDLMLHYGELEDDDGFNCKPSLFMEAQETILHVFKRDVNFSNSLADLVPVNSYATQVSGNIAHLFGHQIMVHVPDSGLTIPVIAPAVDLMVKPSYFTEELKEYLSIWVSTIVVPALRAKQHG